MTYQCLICFENCKHPAILDLNCECQYNVHYKCYHKWWKMKKNCMICQTPAGKARSYYHFKDKTDYHFLLDLHHKPNKLNNLTLKDIIPNFKYHIVFIVLSLIIDYIFFDINFGFILVYLSFYFFWMLP